jgi:Tfp pilus assembly protein PilN
MIHTNLSTRPFYNERLVHSVLLLVAVVVAVVTVVNALAIVTLSQRDAALGSQTALAEQKAVRARRAADAVRRSIDATSLQAVAAAAREANGLIDRRTFSWTALLGELEAALPPDVRVGSVQPRVDKDGRMTIELVVVARTAEDINTFAEKLEARHAFENLLFRQEDVNPEGLLETTLVGRYVGEARPTDDRKGAQ